MVVRRDGQISCNFWLSVTTLGFPYNIILQVIYHLINTPFNPLHVSSQQGMKAKHKGAYYM